MNHFESLIFFKIDVIPAWLLLFINMWFHIMSSI